MRQIIHALPKKMVAFIAFLIVVLIVLIFLVAAPQQKSPPQQTPSLLPTPFIGQITFDEPPSPIIDQQYETPPQIVWNISNPTLRTSARIFKTQYAISENRASQIAKSFGFTDQPEVFNNPTTNSTTATWSSGQQGQSFSVTLTSGYLEYLNNVIQGKADIDSAPPKKLESQTRVAENARDFLLMHGLLPSNITTSTNNVRLFNETVSHPDEIDSFPNATLYQVVFVQQVDNIPLYIQFGVPLDVSVWMTNTNIVKKVSLFYTQIVGGSSNKPLLSFSEIQEQITEGNAYFYTFGEDDELIDITLTSVQLDSIQLIYLDDRTTGFIYPYFLLKGEDVTTGNEVRVYTSAVKN